MEKVYTLMQERYQIHIKEMENIPENIPEWKELFGVRYKYYNNKDITVKFDIHKRELKLQCLEQKINDIYEIKYPRFTSRGVYDKSKYYQFFFSVIDESGQNAVVVVKADRIENYQELCESELYVNVRNEEDFFKTEDMVKYQKHIYRQLGLGMGLQDVNVDEMELSKLGMSILEFEYGLTQLKLRCQNDYLVERFREFGITRYEFLDIIKSCENATCLMGKKVKAIGLKKADYMEIRYLMELRSRFRLVGEKIIDILEIKDVAENKRNRRMIQIGFRLEQLIYMDKFESLKTGKNVLQTIRFCGMDIKDIDMMGLTDLLLEEVKKKNLSVIEMLEMVFNHKRTLKEALGIKGAKMSMGLGYATL